MHVPAASRTSPGVEPTVAQPARKAVGGRSFKDALRAEDTAPSKATATTSGGAAAATTAPAATATRRGPRNEQTEAVPGHAYREITAGPRNGMMLNTSGNVRDGQAFTLVERNGWHYHIYGTGKDRQIFRLPDRDG